MMIVHEENERIDAEVLTIRLSLPEGTMERCREQIELSCGVYSDWTEIVVEGCHDLYIAAMRDGPDVLDGLSAHFAPLYQGRNEFPEMRMGAAFYHTMRSWG